MGGFELDVDLADGHAAVQTPGLSLSGCGSDLSPLARAGTLPPLAVTSGQGVNSSLTSSMGDVLYTDSSGMRDTFCRVSDASTLFLRQRVSLVR